MNEAIELAPVASSACAAIGYDAASETLHIRYHARGEDEVGALWTYTPVLQDFYDEMTAPDASIGRALALLKKNPEITARRIVEGAQLEDLG